MKKWDKQVKPKDQADETLFDHLMIILEEALANTKGKCYVGIL